jgi:hypothetical protein
MMDYALMHQGRIEPGQGGRGFEHHLGGVFAFTHAPIVGKGQRAAKYCSLRVALLDQGLQQARPVALQVGARQGLGLRCVLARWT